MNAPEEKCLVLPDGRQLSYQEFGAASGRPVFYCHGFPACRLEAGLVATVAEKLDLRLIAPDRPGYGLSDLHPGHTLTDWANDLAVLADHLNYPRFGILGVSGGGPYALAVAHALPSRVEKVVLVCPLGPLDTRGAFRDFALPARLFLYLARSNRVLLKYLVRGVALPVRLGRPGMIFCLLAAVPSPADRRILEDSQVRGQLESIVGEAFRQGSSAIFEELVRYVSPWDFNLSEIAVPVMLWHGEADRTVPVESGRRLAADLPNCRLKTLPGEGHYSLPLEHAEPILRGLNPDEGKSFS